MATIAHPSHAKKTAPHAQPPGHKPASAQQSASATGAQHAAPQHPHGKSGYAAQQASHKPKQGPIQADGAVLINNDVLKEQGKPSGASAMKPGQQPPGTFLVKGQAFGSLDEVQQWLSATQPQDPELVISVTPGCQVACAAQTLWYYYNPNQKIVLDGQGGSVTGLHSGRPTPGYFLSYRPAVGDGTSAERPAAANLEVKNLSIRGFESGGIEISPQRVAGKQNDWDGGLAAFVGGAAIHDVQFRDLGLNKKSSAESRLWNNMRFGAGGVTMRGVQKSTIERCQFQNLTNGQMTFDNTDDQGNKTTKHGEGDHLFHAVYMRDGSSGNVVQGNTFDHVGGDPVRVSNGSNKNVIDGNTSRDSGQNGMVSNWFNSAKKPPEVDSTGTVIRNNHVGKLLGGKKQAAVYNRKESKGKQAQLNT